MVNGTNLSTATPEETTLFSTSAFTTVYATTTELGPNVTTESPVTVTESPEEPANYTNDCRWLLYAEIGDSRVRIWDLIILIPNALFLAFLLIGLRTALLKLKRTNSSIFKAFYGLVFCVAVISVLRCVVSMTVNAAVPMGNIADKLLWLILRFFLLATELSVVTFGIAFGHLDSRTSIRRVIMAACVIALIYSVTQGTLEFLLPNNKHYYVSSSKRNYDIFGHGGMMFWFVSSACFSVVYVVIIVLPYTPVRLRFQLPLRRSFYAYCGFLAALNLLQAVGSGLLYADIPPGLCVVDGTTYIYFTCFAPLVYFTFLRDFFRNSQPPNILFSYKAQVDELDEQNVSLPQHGARDDHQAALPDELFDHTHFDAESPNPLYIADLRFGELAINADVSAKSA